MKKRIFSLLLAALMILSLAACGSSGGGSSSSGSGDDSSSTSEPSGSSSGSGSDSSGGSSSSGSGYDLSEGDYVIGLSNSFYGNTWRRQMVDSFTEAAEEAKAAERKMIEVALKHGVQPRCEIPNAEAAQYYIDLGVRHFCVGDQVNALKGFWNTQGPKMKEIASRL